MRTILVLCFAALLFASYSKADDNVTIHCIMGEARGEGLIGMTAVAEAIRNRGTLSGVYGCQASFNEPERIWEIARRAWKDSETSNLVHEATHWESDSFPMPYWAKQMIETAHIGKHRFYRNL